MLLYRVSIIAIISFIAKSHRIFSGMDELDQISEDEITTGGNVLAYETPYIAAVFNSLLKAQTCTGFIIHERFVIAAGYCVTLNNKIVDPVYVSVLSGVVDFRNHDFDQWRYATSIITLTKKYKEFSVLVLIKLSEPFYLDMSCDLIDYRYRVYSKKEVCNSISWLFFDVQDRCALKSLVLKKQLGRVINKTICSTTYGSNPVLSGIDHLEFVCLTFDPQLDTDLTCMGSDGSALICTFDGTKHSSGLAIKYRGDSKCNRADIPYVFINIGAYSEWIDENISL